MKRTLIKLNTGDIYPISNFSFWANNQVVLHTDEGYSDDPQQVDTVFNDGEWKFVEQEIVPNTITWEESIAREVKRKEIDKFINRTFTFENIKFPTDDFIKKNCGVGDDWYKSPNWIFFDEVRRVYRNQAYLERNCINKFELEPYGFSTQLLIDSLMNEVNRHDAWLNYRREIYFKEGIEVNF
jgi:hypothetical protein